MSFESYSALDGDHGSAAPRKRRKRVDECLIRTLHKLIVNPKTRSRHYVVNTSYELHKKLKKRNQGLTVARSTLNGLVHRSVKFVESKCVPCTCHSITMPAKCLFYQHDQRIAMGQDNSFKMLMISIYKPSRATGRLCL